MSERSQFVSYTNVNSDARRVSCGVPQGSILGPLLFIIYTKDLPKSLTMTKSILFADDTTVYASSSSLHDLINVINADLTHLADWFCANRLSLNVSKTNYVLFSKKSITVHPNIKIGNTTIDRKQHVKFLGVIVDEKLEWSEHIIHCKAKLSSSLYAINSCKRYLTSGHLLMLYNCLIYSHLSYGVLLWGSTFQSYLNNIISMQKRAVRIVGHAPYNAHTSPIFTEFKILKLPDIYTLHLGKYMFMQQHLMLPEPLIKRFTFNRDIHSHDTRQRDCLHKCTRRTAIAAKSFMHRGPDYWNTLPEYIRLCPSIKCFNKKHKQHLINQYALLY